MHAVLIFVTVGQIAAREFSCSLMSVGTRIVFFALCLLLAGAAFWAHQHDKSLRDGAAQVQIGDPNEVVRSLLGDPSREEDCGSMTAVPNGCHQEYIYRYMLSILRPEYEVIWFDSSGRVLGETRVVSP